MIMLKKMLKLSICLMLCIVLYCTINLSDNGGGSEVGNGVITGKIYFSDGAPASNTAVMLRRKDFLKDTSETYKNKGIIDSADTFTNNKGNFYFGSVDTGHYYIEASGGDSLGVLLVCTVTQADSVVSIPPDTLTPAGNISGTVTLYGGPKAKTYIQIYGLDRVAETDSAGNFTIKVPEGEFMIRVVIGSPEYREVNIPEIRPDGAPVCIPVLSEIPVSDSWECDTMIIRAILDSNDLHMISADSVIDGIQNGRINSVGFGLPAIHTIPSILGGLQTLEDLDIEKTLVSHVPSRIGELIYITNLGLDSNKLTTLPLEITNLILLEELDLSYNKLKNLLPAVKAWADKFDPDWADTQDTTAVRR